MMNRVSDDTNTLASLKRKVDELINQAKALGVEPEEVRVMIDSPEGYILSIGEVIDTEEYLEFEDDSTKDEKTEFIGECKAVVSSYAE